MLCRRFLFQADGSELMGGFRPFMLGNMDRLGSPDGGTSRGTSPLPAGGRVPPRLVTRLDAGGGETVAITLDDSRVRLLPTTIDRTSYITTILSAHSGIRSTDAGSVGNPAEPLTIPYHNTSAAVHFVHAPFYYSTIHLSCLKK